MKKVKFEIEITLVKGYESPTALCQRVPLQHLIRECNLMARKGRELTHMNERGHNARFLGLHALTKENIIINRSVKEALRIIDAYQSKCQRAKKNFRH